MPRPSEDHVITTGASMVALLLLAVIVVGRSTSTSASVVR
jgi:hypothetical protein